MASLLSLTTKSIIHNKKLNDDNVYIILWRLHDIKLSESDVFILIAEILARYKKKDILKLLLEYLNCNPHGIRGNIKTQLIKSVSLEIIYSKNEDILKCTNTNKLLNESSYLKSAFETIVLTKPIDLIEYFFSNVNQFASDKISVSFISIGKILKIRSYNLKIRSYNLKLSDANNVIDILMKFSIIESINRIENSEIITLIKLCGQSKTNDLLKKYISNYEEFVLHNMDIFLIDDMRSSIKNFSMKNNIHGIVDKLHMFAQYNRPKLFEQHQRYFLNSIYAISVYIDSAIIKATEEERKSFNMTMILIKECLENVNYMSHGYDIANLSLSHQWIDYQNKILTAIKEECRYSGIFIDRCAYLV